MPRFIPNCFNIRNRTHSDEYFKEIARKDERDNNYKSIKWCRECGLTVEDEYEEGVLTKRGKLNMPNIHDFILNGD